MNVLKGNDNSSAATSIFSNYCNDFRKFRSSPTAPIT